MSLFMKSLFRSNSKRNGNIFALIFDFSLNSKWFEFKFSNFKAIFYFWPPESCFWHFLEKSDFSDHFLSFFFVHFLVDLAGEKLFFLFFIFPPFFPPFPPCFSLFFFLYFSYFTPLHRAARARARATSAVRLGFLSFKNGHFLALKLSI